LLDRASHMTCMYPPPHMTCMYPPPRMTCKLTLLSSLLDRASFFCVRYTLVLCWLHTSFVFVAHLFCVRYTLVLCSLHKTNSL
jgi:hypothetical protein